uniref:Uncharacterized protein n=1 Tax=Tanacetum cinerariifolium TaxID=118510 RepID=A0A699JKG5_TANCI|nr:hypothetical protein [Tanacetum cinerariifolium]
MEDCASWDLTTEAHGRSGEGEEWIWCGAGVQDDVLGMKGVQGILAGKGVRELTYLGLKLYDFGISLGFDFDLWARKVPELGFLIF